LTPFILTTTREYAASSNAAAIMDSERTYQAKVIHRHPVTVVRTRGKRGNITDEILEVRNSVRREGEEDSGREVKKIEVRSTTIVPDWQI